MNSSLFLRKMDEVARIYDELHRVEALKHSETFPVHKRLKLPESQDLADWIAGHISLKKDQSVLDAGCGNGHTLITLAQQAEIKGLGISLSEREIYSASAHARQLNLSALQFETQNFNSVFSKNFDWIIAIESLRHSPDFMFSVRNLFDHLAPSGTLVIAEEFMDDIPLSREHHALWASTNPGTAGHFNAQLRNEQISFKSIDLTGFVPVRHLILLNSLITITRILAKLNNSRNLKTYLGALMLEKLYATGTAHYHVYFIKKNI